MSRGLDPRGDLPTTIQPSFVQRTAESARDRRRPTRLSTQPADILQKQREHRAREQRQTCYDWIFSSASNVHIAIDRSSFKTYTPFKSYVLAVADQHQVAVRGIGSVELAIRRKPGSKDAHTVVLENVLYAPKWMCNIFSADYFDPITAFEHIWTDSGVSWMVKKDDGTLRYWGFTEDFCGLERIVLARDYHGRSPMLDDRDREAWSVNVNWPDGQRDKWEAELAKIEAEQRKKQEDSLKHFQRPSTVADFRMKELDPNAIPVRRSVQIDRKSKG